MNDVLVKLKSPVPDFKYFAEDQILTAGDLNRVVNFLDRQHRMTRSYTLGVGIVCGLDPSLEASSRVGLSKGAAITTDGDLLVLDDDATYSHFQKYRDQEAKYQQFRKATGQIIPMWELHREAGVGRLPMNRLENAENLNLDDLVVLLYLESFIDPEEACEGQDCDKRGDRQVRNLKVLLVKTADIAETTKPLVKTALDLPTLTAARVRLGGARITAYSGSSGLAKRYSDSIKLTKTMVKQALGALSRSSFRTMIESVMESSASWTTQLEQPRFRHVNNTARIQYIYEFFNDLVDAYNEWRECACQLPGECLPDPDLFAKHIVAGELNVNVATTDRTRHYFRNSALLSHGDAAAARCHFLLRRIDVLIRSFQARKITQIRVTPSKHRGQKLSARAIPYYFFDLPNTPNPRTAWSFDANRSGNAATIQSYHSQGDAEAGEEAKSPFLFDIGQYDFLRIEGHLDRKIDDVEKDLEALRKDHNLPFQVLAVQVDDVLEKVRLPGKLRFPDLDAMFRLKKMDVLNSVRAAKDFGEFAVSNVFNVSNHPKKTDATNLIASFNFQIKNTFNSMPRSPSDFNSANAKTFNQSLQGSFKAAEQYQKVSADIFRPTKSSPIQSFLNPKRFRDYGLLMELYDKRRKKVKEKSIFANFLLEQPGIEYLGGVPMGGTFVLIYEADSRQVLADFSLPYYSYFDLSTLDHEDLDEPDEPVYVSDPIIPQPLPTPIVFKPPYVFNPDPWTNENSYRIDVLRGDAITAKLNLTLENLNTQFDIRLAKANVELDGDLSKKVLQAKSDIERNISQRFAENRETTNLEFSRRVDESKKIFQDEIKSKIDTIKFRDGRIAGGFDVGGLSGGAIASPVLTGIMRDIGETRDVQNELLIKKSIGGNLTLKEDAALTVAEDRLTDLVVEATKQPILADPAAGATVNKPNDETEALVRTLRNVSLGIEGKRNRNRILSRINALGNRTFTGRQLGGIKNVMNRN